MAALEPAADELDQLEPLDQRRILATFAGLTLSPVVSRYIIAVVAFILAAASQAPA